MAAPKRTPPRSPRWLVLGETESSDSGDFAVTLFFSQTSFKDISCTKLGGLWALNLSWREGDAKLPDPG